MFFRKRFLGLPGLAVLAVLAAALSYPVAGAGTNQAPSLSGAAPLGIQPSLDWTTYLGGSVDDVGNGIALDTQGNIYITGYTMSNGWTMGELGSGIGGPKDAFVTKLSPTGQHLWSTYLGGGGDECGEAIAVDDNGNIYVCGETESDGWISGGFDTTFHGNTIPYTNKDGFLAKLSPRGEILWSTYLGGNGDDWAYDCVIDKDGNVAVAGSTYSGGWLKGGYNTTYDDHIQGGDGYVIKFSPDGHCLWGTYLGGTLEDFGLGIGVDSKGNILATGEAQSDNWITGGYNTAFVSGMKGYVVKISPDGHHLWSTYLYGTDRWSDTWGKDITADFEDNVLITGWTANGGWTSGGYDTTFNGPPLDHDAFVVKLSPDGVHLWSTYVGGSGIDEGNKIATDGAGNICVVGNTDSTGWVTGGFNSIKNAGDDVFIARISPSGQLLWSSFLGGSDYVYGNGLALDGPGNLYLTGSMKRRNEYNTNQKDIYVVRITVGGSLRVALFPAIGAQWRRVGTSLWRDSGAMDSDIPSGSCSVEFKAPSGWVAPSSKYVRTQMGQTTLTSATCARQNAVPSRIWTRY